MRFLRILLTVILGLLLAISFLKTGEGRLLPEDAPITDPQREETKATAPGTGSDTEIGTKTGTEIGTKTGVESGAESDVSHSGSEAGRTGEKRSEAASSEGSLSEAGRTEESARTTPAPSTDASSAKIHETVVPSGSAANEPESRTQTESAHITVPPTTIYQTEETMLTETEVQNSTAPAETETDTTFYFRLANQAVSDMLSNFWDAEHNHMIPTWDGLPVTASVDQRGSFWETAQCLYALYDLWYLTRDTKYEKMLQGQAKFIKENFTAAELTQAGGNENWAVDDCAWNCMLYLILYRMTGDTWFIEVTDGLLNSVTARWGDDVTGGGLWYNDTKTIKSVYQLGCVISWLRLWEITGEQRYYDQAFAQYQWMQNVLSRGDGLYWCDYGVNGPRGSLQDIHEAGSSSFLTGNMGMAALSVMFYRLTGNEAYRAQALKTCEGILRYYNDNGVLLDDRDGWTNGAFASYFASYVLTMDGTEELRSLCRATARSIIQNARTADGYYGATWKGPAEGEGSIWFKKGTIPRQSATTGSAISMVTSMAILEAGITDYKR